MIYELCHGKTLNESLYDVKGEFYKGERIYMVNHSHLYHCLRNNKELLADLVRRITTILNVFHKCGVVYADLKPDNILIDFDDQN
jgi:serine/threonine protein kinase